MKRRYHVAGVIAALLISAAFIAYVARALHGRDLSIYASPRALIGIVLAASMYGLGVPLLALAWREMLRGLGVSKSWRELTAILGMTQIAKYVPGNVGQYVGRAAMSFGRGIPTRAFAVTLVLETLLLIAAALSVGVSTGLMSSVGLEVLQSKGWQLAAILMLVAAIAGSLVVFRRMAPRLLKRIAPQHAHLLEGQLLPDRACMALAFGLYCLTNLCIGFGLVLLARWLLPQGSASANWLLLACFALAWVVGFATPGAPAGLGVREGLLLVMLGPVFTPALASILIIALRLATTLGDLAWFLGGYLLLPKYVPSSSMN